MYEGNSMPQMKGLNTGYKVEALKNVKHMDLYKFGEEMNTNLDWLNGSSKKCTFILQWILILIVGTVLLHFYFFSDDIYYCKDKTCKNVIISCQWETHKAYFLFNAMYYAT